jgi:hydroxymethylbilane synthase
LQATRIRIGTRGSPLALAQANQVKAKIMSAHHLSDEAVTVHVIKTTGDQVLDRSLSEIGGKGLFTKEIEEALLGDTIDVAVHSMKDMQTVLPDGLVIGAVLEREDARDAFISLRYSSLAEIPAGGVVGTSSLRRKAQLLHARPDLRVVEFRGNVQTRLRKLEEGVADATFLAMAGLKRLGLEDRITVPVALSDMLPAVAQGAIGLEIRADDSPMAAILASLNHTQTAWCVDAERSFLARLEGSCRTPIAGYGTIENSTLTFRGELLSPDGARCYEVSRSGAVEDAFRLGLDAADEILGNADASLLVRSDA